MKTNVPIELTDGERGILANLIDQKYTKRLATRAEIIAICQQHVGGLIQQTGQAAKTHTSPSDLYHIDDEDREFLKNKPPAYVRGWNQVKRKRGAKAA